MFKTLKTIFALIQAPKSIPNGYCIASLFTTLKSYFSILTTHFYKTPPISFSILEYIILKYYKIILFLYIFFHTPTKPTASIKTPGADQPQPQQLDQQSRSTTHSHLLNHGNPP